jgi:transcriptional regulator with XRE-family HTH domain
MVKFKAGSVPLSQNPRPIASPLRALRQRRHLPQERLAALAGLSRGWVGFLERNPESMTPTAAEKLAAVLGVRPEELAP